MIAKFILTNCLVISTLLIAGCKKETTKPNEAATAPFSIEFDNIVGGSNLQLGTGIYRNAKGESYSVDLLQYLISNVTLKTTQGVTYTVPQDSSYFLLKEGADELRFARMNIPEGDYSELSFLIGVDSIRSTMGIEHRQGALDPSGGMEDGMYWGWNPCYIFVKLEGTSPDVELDPTGQRKFRYHIGGYGGYRIQNINNIKKITLDLSAGGIAKVRSGRLANVHLLVDISKVFDGPVNISLAEHPSVMFSEFSTNVANNYVQMFYHDHTEN